MKKIIIRNELIGEMSATLLLDKNPETVKAIWDVLPLELNLSKWGEEFSLENLEDIDLAIFVCDIDVSEFFDYPIGFEYAGKMIELYSKINKELKCDMINVIPNGENLRGNHLEFVKNEAEVQSGDFQ